MATAVTESTRTTLWRAGRVTVKYPLTGIRSNIYKNTMTLFMSEVLYRAVKDGAREDGLFEYLEARYGDLLKRIAAGFWEDSDVATLKEALQNYKR